VLLVRGLCRLRWRRLTSGRAPLTLTASVDLQGRLILPDDDDDDDKNKNKYVPPLPASRDEHIY
jgi:hypothetical protein